MNRAYIAIDLKSFYASVECRERKLDPLTTNLVVADASRTQKTICLAVSPALKSIGIPGRPRLFEVEQKVKEENARRRASGQEELTYITAVPRMALYMEYSTRIYNVYLKYVSAEDMHVYSIDEVFMDVTDYLATYKMTPHELAKRMIQDVEKTTGITATAGIGTNLYLCKVALDIMSKKVAADEDGVRIAELDEMSYRKLLWEHKPLTDFWRVGRGYAKKLESYGLYTMGDIARCSIGKANEFYNEELLYRAFGINAELLIDHAWGWEPTTIAAIKAYKPQNSSVGSGQVLHCAYPADKAKLIVKEMTDLLVLDLVDKQLVAEQMVLTLGYDIDNLTDPSIRKKYHGEVTTDRYGRQIPKHAHGSINLPEQTSSTKVIMEAVMELYDSIVNPDLLVRRVNIAANKVVPESEKRKPDEFEQLNLFMDYDKVSKERQQQEQELEREKRMQHAILDIQKRYGKNALLKGMNLEEDAMTIKRNGQIGGHKA